LACSSASAPARFRCWDRSAWQVATTPVGTCTARTADAVTLTCCPPAPEDRNVSMRTSLRLRAELLPPSLPPLLSCDAGNTATWTKDVWRPPLAFVGEARTTRCTPVSSCSHPNASGLAHALEAEWCMLARLTRLLW